MKHHHIALSPGRARRYAVTLTTALAVWAAPAAACLHAGGGTGETPVTQGGQQAIILHKDGVQDLILRVQYKADPAKATHLGWVIPVPSVPSQYATASASLFAEMDAAVKLKRVYRPRSIKKGAKSAGGSLSVVRLLPAAQAGPYRIQPIQASGDGAAAGLNKWMAANGFQPIAKASLEYYTARGWTFLAIRVDPQQGQTALAAEGGLPPLHITFASERAVYPLKLSTHGGIFAARVYLLTADALPNAAFDGARARGFEVVNSGRYLDTPKFRPGTLEVSSHRFSAGTAPAALKPLLTKRFGAAEARLAVLFSQRVNHTEIDRWKKSRWAHVRFAPQAWSEDLSVPGLPEGKRLQGTAR